MDASETQRELEAVDRVLTTTRAIRRRFDLDRPVEAEVVLDCLRIASQAPSGGAIQRGRWVVLTDPERRRALADVYRRADDGFFQQMIDASDPDRARIYRNALEFIDVLPRVPVLVVACAEVGSPLEESEHVAVASWYGGVLPAVWSFQLALRARGLGSVWTTLHLRREAEAAALLGLPGNVRQVALLPVGYTRGTDFSPAPRRPVEEIVHWEQW